MRCDSCGVCADEGCINRADRKLKCKPVSIDSISMKHHWVKGNYCANNVFCYLANLFPSVLNSLNIIGNLPPESMCHVCDEECGIDKHLSDFYCCWCQRCVHEKCLPNLAHLCNLGSYRNFIIPPNCITLRRSPRGRLRSQCLVASIREPQWGPQWKPLIVIGIRISKV